MPTKPLDCKDISEDFPEYGITLGITCCCHCKYFCGGLAPTPCIKKATFPGTSWRIEVCCGVWRTIRFKENGKPIKDIYKWMKENKDKIPKYKDPQEYGKYRNTNQKGNKEGS